MFCCSKMSQTAVKEAATHAQTVFIFIKSKKRNNNKIRNNFLAIFYFQNFRKNFICFKGLILLVLHKFKNFIFCNNFWIRKNNFVSNKMFCNIRSVDFIIC